MSNQPTENDRKRAEAIRDIIINSIVGRGKFRGWASEVADDAMPEIQAALSEARRVPEGHVRTPDGVDRKVAWVTGAFNRGGPWLAQLTVEYESKAAAESARQPREERGA